MKPVLIFTCAFLLILSLNNVLPFASFATTNPSNIIRVPEDFSTVQSAINNASSGDTILVANGTFNEHLTINKSITLIGAGVDYTILNGTMADTAIKITANNTTIKGFTIQHFRTGIIVNQSQNIYIAENQITQVQTKGATYITNSKNITLAKNTITNNNSSGISMLKSNSTNFLQNDITHNVGVGIYFENCTDFNATDNQVESNGGDAICCTYAYNLYITRNIFALNDYRGIWAANSNGTIFHNNFVRNRENARSILSNLKWDDGYPSGGNYWSNYTGNDLFSGASQNLTGSDGIGDLPLSLPQESEQDKYPLMGNFTTQTTTIDTQNYTVDFVSNAVITKLYTNKSEKTLCFTINNSKPEGFCRITIPTGLMWCDNKDQWIVTVNNNLTNHPTVENGNFTYIYFNVTQDACLVKITATHIIPENNLFALLFFLVSVLFIVIWARGKYKKTRIKTYLHENFHTQVKIETKGFHN